MYQGLDKIISGGQTGADIAGVDAAIKLGIPYGGTIPKGRRAENSIVPLHYSCFIESDYWEYPVRTEQNVRDSDGTVIFIEGHLSGGSEMTRKFAVRHKKPVLVINFSTSGFIADVASAADLLEFIIEHKIKVLNVAGSRESKRPGIHDKVVNFIVEALST